MSSEESLQEQIDYLRSQVNSLKNQVNSLRSDIIGTKVENSIYERSSCDRTFIKKTRVLNELEYCETAVYVGNKKYTLTTEDIVVLAELLNKIEMTDCEFSKGIEDHCYRMRKHYAV